ncbi:PVC-type heme-binding CxxCH protein [Parapedobacter lycopersici]|uniref:PVC-type heme-binding CxxCH protein n=1 Tax=Parapedobacter lycopersici TaxID=1864939 RepID=UPI00214D7786
MKTNYSMMAGYPRAFMMPVRGYTGLFLLLGLSFFFVGCSRHAAGDALDPKAALNAMVLDPDFDIELVAAEPLVMAPVVMIFDEYGRMWVTEMDGFMPDTLGTGEDQPVGRIVQLTDTDGDGQADKRTVFLDSLVMPRALCLIGGGLLVAEPPNLWFYEIENDRPGARTLVDSAYAEGGNVEHQPNGLFRALDNWVYSAKSDRRYRRLPDGTWQQDKTHFRGQWGISQDDWGRLYYNDNSSNVSGDYFPPGQGAGNPDQRRVAGYGEAIVRDKRVYPIHPTPGVNRGYMDGILDSAGHLTNFTAACGPLFYRGGLMTGMNVFVAEPAANLIKWNILDTAGYRTTGEQVYADKEFLASRDERFRPVNLYNGPDGSIYILDMYRGIIQHSTYLTPYLKKEIATRGLELPLGMGRIYRVFPKTASPQPVKMPQHTAGLVSALGDKNGWVRDKAQQLLVDRQAVDAASALRTVLRSDQYMPIHRVHALWTLEGLNQLTLDDVQVLLEHPLWQVRAQALAAMPSLAPSVAPTRLIAILDETLGRRDTLIAPYAALAAAALIPALPAGSVGKIMQRATAFETNPEVSDALISGMAGREPFVMRSMRDTATVLYRHLATVVEERGKRATEANQARLAEHFPTGSALFKTTCQPCHGADGQGVPAIAPPLAGSAWVTGNKDRLMALVLYGLTGPVDVAGHTYATPEVSGEMPGIAHHPTMEDAALAELLSYIRVAWGNQATVAVLPEELSMMRSRFHNRTAPFTQEELYRHFGKE